jgi:hypothetical protein
VSTRSTVVWKPFGSVGFARTVGTLACWLLKGFGHLRRLGAGAHHHITTSRDPACPCSLAGLIEARREPVMRSYAL